jgi:F-type H+-transporting ATPase subunit epsilon
MNKIEAEEVTLTSTSGVITILPGHIPLISSIKAGELSIKKDGLSTPFAVFKGVVHVKEISSGTTEIVVLVDRSEKAEEIDLSRAEESYTRAKTAMEEERESDIDFARFEGLIEKELNRIRVSKKYR